MRREAWIVLLGIGLVAPIQLEAQQSGRRAVPSYRNGNPAASACRPRSRRARPKCANDLRPIRVASGRIRGAAVGRTWVPVDWGDVFIRRTAGRDPFDTISQGRLKRMLGKATVSRLRAVGRRSGLRGALRGDWFVGARQGAILVVSIGGREVAQFVDYNRDGWVDSVRLSARVTTRTVYTYR